MAKYSENQVIPLRPDYLVNAVAAVLNQLGWTYQMNSNAQFYATTSISFTSFGENITVEIFSDSMVKVESKSAVPFQLVDWGRNRKNVQTFFTQLRIVANVG